MSDNSQPEDIYKKRKAAAIKLKDAAVTLCFASFDSYAPVTIRNMIEVVELRLTDLKKLYS